MRKQIFGALIVAAGIALLGGCAGTGPSPAAMPLPPAKALQPADLASLAGEWGGTLQGVSGQFAGRRTNQVRVTVAPDGSFTSNINGVPGAGRGKIEAAIVRRIQSDAGDFAHHLRRQIERVTGFLHHNAGGAHPKAGIGLDRKSVV